MPRVPPRRYCAIKFSRPSPGSPRGLGFLGRTWDASTSWKRDVNTPCHPRNATLGCHKVLAVSKGDWSCCFRYKYCHNGSLHIPAD
ncbi:hypothetical protein BJY04DRAFT_43502 [Aspergillus karnatakaensis]|uniref:uncharacterized protein n=1 Tax=Aspergillus karnatakaensis TaxID=1810916 RepID=UPI003CCE28F8